MQIPSFLNDLIRQDLRLSAAVGAALAAIDPFIRNSQLPFFPEYTDHGPKHNEEVLQTAVDLMHEDAVDLITPQDAAVLVLATLLHDCGMHLTEDGFLTLIDRDCLWTGVPAFGDVAWHELWEDFVGEARRFDGRTLTALFGDSEPIQRPPLDPNKLTRRDRLLIGEFLRRHHARLAHEIAIRGVPASSGTTVPVLRDLSRDFSDLSGIVARSHGTSLRRCMDHLRDSYHLQDFQGIHAIFLMVALRVADYLQIQARRAPLELLKTRRLRSPISQGEWKLHASIRNVTSASADPEAIYVDARPPDVKTYLRIKSWLDGIQAELDTSWAVLGEVYGRYSDESLDRLKLRMRRVRSSLDDINAFSRTVTYVPAKVAFDAFNPDLLKLLVRPLYGDRPELGIRELLQNAVDAVNERKVYLEKFPDSDPHETNPECAEVEIVISSSDSIPRSVTVKDRGIGMTLDVLLNYFLKAGASFRCSDAWKKVFEDETGHSEVARSGRFGIGVLAAFILGHKIDVVTRHVAQPADKGLRFSAQLDTDQIELQYTTCASGTTVTVEVDDAEQQHVKAMLESKYTDPWDFYCLQYPTLERRVDPGGRLKRQRWEFKPDGWERIEVDGYNAVYWAYKDFSFLTCNGIIVIPSLDRRMKLEVEETYDSTYSFRHPNVFIMDNDGRLPLNLQRTALIQDRLPFSKVLTDSIIQNAIDWMRYNKPRGSILEAEHFASYLRRYPGLIVKGSFGWSDWAMIEDGVSIVERGVLAGMGVTSYYSCRKAWCGIEGIS